MHSVISAEDAKPKVSLQNSHHHLCEQGERPLQQAAVEVDLEGCSTFVGCMGKEPRHSEETEAELRA